jgi:PAS domain S-box-containing protein
MCSVLAWSATEATPTAGPREPPTQYVHNTWTTEEGLPQNSVNAIAQTRDGYVWLATFGGLARFDGVKFTVFDVGNTPALRSNRIRLLYEDRQGVLWIGTEEGYLVRLADGTFTPVQTDGTPADNRRSVLEDRQGRLWMETIDGLIRWDGGRATAFTTKNGLPNNVVLCLFEDRQGAVWVGTQRGAARWKDGQWTSYTPETGLAYLDIAVLCEDREGTLWLGGPGGLISFQAGKSTVHTTTLNAPQNAVHAMMSDQAGNVWIGTDGGLVRHRGGSFTTFTKKDGLSDETVRCLLEDREGNLWIGTNAGGLNRFKAGAFTVYGPEQGLPHEVVTSITEDQQGAVWIGTNSRGVARLQDGRMTTYTTKDGLRNDAVWALLADREGAIWMGSWMTGLTRFKDGQATIYTTANSRLPNDTVLAMYQDRAGTIWFGTAGGLGRFRDGAFTTYRTSDGLVHNDVRFIAEDRQGALWIGTVGGLSRFKDGRFTNYTTANGLSYSFVRAIHEDADGVLWIGTYGGGLNRFKDGRWTHYTRANGLFDDAVSRILEDARGNLWMSGNRGIFRAGRSELNDFAEGRARSFNCIAYGLADGMESSECNGGSQPAGWKTRDGRLWFPTLKGAVVIDPNKSNPQPPAVLIEQVLVKGRPVDARGNIELPPGQDDLEIHYTSPSFVAPEKIRFKYRLEGYNADWVDAGTRRVAYYTHVAPGRYRFHVMAANNDGVWSETGATFAFSLRPRFYQTLWFLAACVVGAFLLGSAGYQLRLRQLKRRTRALEEKVGERTAEVVEQRNQLSVANHQLARANHQLSRANDDLLSTFNRMRVGVMTTDHDGQVTFLNHAAKTLIGLPQAEAVRQPWEHLLSLSDREAAQLKAMFERPAGQRAKLPVHLSAGDGRRYWMEIEVESDPRDPQRRIFFLYDMSETYDLRRLLDERAKFQDLVGQSPAMQIVYQQIQDVAKVDATVLVKGETGTGKELAARAIHYASPRKTKPFVAVNCAGLTESLLASQLFGHKRGSFTGAIADQVGMFEAAAGGSLFLDEIGDMPMSVQTALLRVLQEKEITRLGETRPRAIDVRLIAATNRDLNREVAEGRFRADLLYRIQVVQIQLPPLRERREDIPLLVAWFLGQARAVIGEESQEVSQDAMQAMMNYAWPGNVRELKSAVESAVICSRGPVIQPSDLPAQVLGLTAAGPMDPLLDKRQRVLQALERTGGNRAAAARLLEISRATLYLWLKELGIKSE